MSQKKNPKIENYERKFPFSQELLLLLPSSFFFSCFFEIRQLTRIGSELCRVLFRGSFASKTARLSVPGWFQNTDSYGGPPSFSSFRPSVKKEDFRVSKAWSMLTANNNDDNQKTDVCLENHVTVWPKKFCTLYDPKLGIANNGKKFRKFGRNNFFLYFFHLSKAFYTEFSIRVRRTN